MVIVCGIPAASTGIRSEAGDVSATGRACKEFAGPAQAPWSRPPGQGGFIPDFGLEIVFLFRGQAPHLPRKVTSLRHDKTQ